VRDPIRIESTEPGIVGVLEPSKSRDVYNRGMRERSVQSAVRQAGVQLQPADTFVALLASFDLDQHVLLCRARLRRPQAAIDLVTNFPASRTETDLAFCAVWSLRKEPGALRGRG
jgi:hypothetical protein